MRLAHLPPRLSYSLTHSFHTLQPPSGAAFIKVTYRSHGAGHLTKHLPNLISLVTIPLFLSWLLGHHTLFSFFSLSLRGFQHLYLSYRSPDGDRSEGSFSNWVVFPGQSIASNMAYMLMSPKWISPGLTSCQNSRYLSTYDTHICII